MKYWYFAEGKVAGPMEGSQLRDLPGFDTATLVCPENKSGTNAEDWKPASDFSELQAEAFTPPPAAPVPAPDNALKDTVLDIQKDLKQIKDRLEELSKVQSSESSKIQNQLNSTVKELQAALNRQAEEMAKMEQRLKEKPPEPEPVKVMPPPPPPIPAAPAAAPKLEPPKPPKIEAKPAPVDKVFDRWAEPTIEEISKKEEKSPEEPKAAEMDFPPLPPGALKAAPKSKVKGSGKKKAIAAAVFTALAGLALAGYFSLGKPQKEKTALKTMPAERETNTADQAFSDIIQELPPPDSFSSGELMDIAPAGGPSEINLAEPQPESSPPPAKPAAKKPAAPKPASGAKKPAAKKAAPPIRAENMVIAPQEPAPGLPGVEPSIADPSDQDIWPE